MDPDRNDRALIRREKDTGHHVRTRGGRPYPRQGERPRGDRPCRTWGLGFRVEDAEERLWGVGCPSVAFCDGDAPTLTGRFQGDGPHADRAESIYPCRPTRRRPQQMHVASDVRPQAGLRACTGKGAFFGPHAAVVADPGLVSTAATSCSVPPPRLQNLPLGFQKSSI